MFLLTIDQSTSATKVLLLDEQGQILDKESREHSQIYPQPGWVEHDAEEIWQNLLLVMRELVERHPDKASQFAGLSLTNQRETFVVFDKQTGRPIYHAIVWQCRRGSDVCEQLRESGAQSTITEKTGLKLDSYFSGSKLKWLITHDAVVREQLLNGQALIGTIDTYLLYRLTQGQVFATDPTNASRTLLMDIQRRDWDGALCDLFDVPKTALPSVREGFAKFGTTDVGGILPCPVPICGVMGDSQASLFAQRCFSPGMVKATFGSGTSVLLNVGSEYPPLSRGAVTALAWVYQGTPTYALEGLINYSSATTSWLINQLGLINSAAETEQLASAVVDNGGVYLVPAFAGLSAPHWSNDARAAILGMTAHTRKEHIVRAALESIGYQVRDVLDMLSREAGVQPVCLYADGGATKNDFLMQFTADITRLEIVAAESAELSPIGAAMAGMLGLGIYRSLDELTALPRADKSYHPRISGDQAEFLHGGWLAAVRRVL